MIKSQWSKYDSQILELYRDDETLGYSRAARILLGEDADIKIVNLLRTYIKRLLTRQADEPDNSTVSEAISRHNLEGTDWKIAWIKEKGISLMVKNREDGSVKSLQEIREEFIDEMKGYAPKYEKLNREPLKDGHCLVIDIADLHIGKLASYLETGNSYSTKKAIKRAKKGVEGILSKASGFQIDQIIFIIGNDVLHIDNTRSSTTSGTPQDTDGMWYDNFKLARELYCSIIESLTLIADVHVVHNPSNHDFMSGFMLADSVSSWFRDNPNVTFDVSMAHRKYTKYGSSMIVTSHGDGAKLEKIPYLAAHEAPQMWADTTHRYTYLHHVHHKDLFKFQAGKDYIGMTVEYMRSPSGTDSWHHRNGYTGVPKAIEAVIHSKDRGQVCRITHIFE